MLTNKLFSIDKQKIIILLLFTGSIFFLPLIISNQYYLTIAIVTGFYAYLALSWNIIGGMAHQISFGHTVFVGIGAYTSTLLFITHGITPWFGMLLGGVLSVLIAIVIGFPCFRLRGAFFSLSTLALAQVVRIIVESTDKFLWFDVRGAAGLLVPLKGQSLLLFQFTDKKYYFYIIWLLVLVVFIITYFLKKSKYGLFLAAIADDEDAAQANGVDVTRVKLIALIISAFFAAIGGTFYAQFYRFIDPASVLAIPLSIEMALIAIVGGSRYVWGPILGAIILTPIGEIVRMTLGGTYAGIHRAIYGSILVIVILLLPDGLASIPVNLVDRIKSSRGG